MPVICVMARADTAAQLREKVREVVHIQRPGCPVDQLVRSMSEELYTVEPGHGQIDALFREVLAGRVYTAVVCEEPEYRPVADQLCTLTGARLVPLADLLADAGPGVTG